MDRPLHVLVIEDNTGDILLLRQHLLNVPELSIKLQTARSLDAGLIVLGNTHFDAILLDLSLPGSVGMETLLAIRKNTPDIPIIVITGFADEDTKMQALRHGAQDYLVKDGLNGKLLAHSIQSCIQRKS